MSFKKYGLYPCITIVVVVLAAWASQCSAAYANNTFESRVPVDSTFRVTDLREGELKRIVERRKDMLPDIYALSKIWLPESPTQEEVRKYIDLVLEVSRNQSRYFDSDPQVSMLVAVGHEHIDDLLYMARGRRPGGHYLAEAITILAREEDKEKVISALKNFPSMVKVIVAKGWQNDAKAELMEGIKMSKSLPTEWIGALSSIGDPETYPALRAYLIEGWNKNSTIKAIKNLPGIRFEDAVAEAWERAGKYDRGYLMEYALEVGYRPALDFAVEHMEDNDGVHQKNFFDYRALVLRFTEAWGTNSEVQQWYETNRDKLIFDPLRKKFLIEGSTGHMSVASESSPASRISAPAKRQCTELTSGAPPSPLERITDMSEDEILKAVTRNKGGPDLASLDRIRLPGEPNRSDIRNYVHLILQLSRKQQSHSIYDPQVSMLEAIGHENIDELFLVARESLREIDYVVAALRRLVRPEDKCKVIRAMQSYTPLAKIIVDNGWEEDARYELLSVVSNSSSYLPAEWLRAVASFNDPSTYPALMNYFKVGWNRHMTYGIIKDLPGIDLSQAVPEAWERARNAPHELRTLTEPALEFGYLRALDYVIENIHNRDMRMLFQRFTDFRGSDVKVKKWYELNRKFLSFDPKQKKFVVKKQTSERINRARDEQALKEKPSDTHNPEEYDKDATGIIESDATDKEKVSALNELGLKAFRAKNLGTAVEIWEKAAHMAERGDVDPDLIAEVFNNYGYGRYLQGKRFYYLAEEYLLKAWRFDPGRWSAYLNLGDLYFDVGAYSRAGDMYKTLLSVKPDYRHRGKIEERLKGIKNGTYKEVENCDVDSHKQSYRLTCGVSQLPRPIEYYRDRVWEYTDLRDLDQVNSFKVKFVGLLPDGNKVYDVVSLNKHLAEEGIKLILIGNDEELYRPVFLTDLEITPTTIEMMNGATIIKAVDYHYRYTAVEVYFRYDSGTGRLVRLNMDIASMVDPEKDLALDCDYKTPHACFNEPAAHQYICHFYDERSCWKPMNGCIAGQIVYNYDIVNGEITITHISKSKSCEEGASSYNSNNEQQEAK